jgi:MoxR-like ATPase
VEERTQAAAVIRDVAQRVKESIGRVIVGRDEVVELALVALLADGHILIEDVPGIGKTTLAKPSLTHMWAAATGRSSTVLSIGQAGAA